MAISGATRSEHAGNISPEEEAKIKAKAREKLGDSKGDPDAEHRVAVAKMHPAKLHQHMQDAMAGKHGPEAQRSAQQVMAPGQGAQPTAPAGKSPFSGDNDADDQPQSSGGNPFAGGQ
jgi:hypothetical protein